MLGHPGSPHQVAPNPPRTPPPTHEVWRAHEGWEGQPGGPTGTGEAYNSEPLNGGEGQVCQKHFWAEVWSAGGPRAPQGNSQPGGICGQGIAWLWT